MVKQRTVDIRKRKEIPYMFNTYTHSTEDISIVKHVKISSLFSTDPATKESIYTLK